jgi:hypothetical protein
MIKKDYKKELQNIVCLKTIYKFRVRWQKRNGGKWSDHKLFSMAYPNFQN